MPQSAPRPCIVCKVLVHGGSRCEQHRLLATGRFGDRGRGSRHERGYGTEWDRTRLRILARDCGICQVCAPGFVHHATEVDHKVSKAEWRRLHGSLDGVDNDSNLQAINSGCHRKKTAREAQQGRGGSDL